ncbi:MAG: competence/damage-inducible protein A [Elusimicrobiota bacterium]|jgi:nicotinamide-nucleotide amidase|nr:competence/damage-inducible protein A [Elusimicrobiota bacterium]
MNDKISIMKAAIITIGDEILLGQITDTNSQYIAKQLTNIGIEIIKIYSISDKKEEIKAAIDAALEYADLVLTTGGLGPTKDDLTKKVLADYFRTELVFNKQAFKWLQEIFASKKALMNEYNRTQALLPKNCKILRNYKGTASAMCFKKGSKVLISLPGVPFEMEHLMQTQVMPLLKEKYKSSRLRYKVLNVYNIAEAELALILSRFEESLPAGITLAYLPSLEMVKLRLTAKGTAVPKLEKYAGKLKTVLKNLYFTEGENNSPQRSLAEILTIKKLTLSTAESCSGGNIAHIITSIPGSSAYYLGGVVAYSNELKKNLLNVNSASLKKYGALSESVAKQMAENIRKITGSDYSVATTGIAGPAGGTPEKPVGTVWIAVSGNKETLAERFLFSANRERNMAKASIKALQMLLNFIVKYDKI